MSLSFTININDLATPALRRHEAALRPNSVMNQYIADSCSAVTQRVFQQMGAEEHNKLGAGSSGFWNRMLSGVQAVATADAAIVRMPREIAQRYFGGTITPKGGKTFLAIPARAEAYNRSPRSFFDLHFVPTRAGGGMMVQNEQTQLKIGRKRKDGTKKVSAGEEIGGGVFYWLVRSVTQAPNKEVLPSEAAYIEAGKAGIKRYLSAFFFDRDTGGAE